MNVLITGGNGFIGSYLVNKFLKKGHKVLNLDKISLFSQNLKINNKNYFFKKVDLLNKKKLKKYFDDFLPHLIVNAAAESHVDRSINQPSFFF